MTAEQKIKQRENIQKVNKLNVTSRPQQYVNPNWLKQSCKHVYEQLCTIHPDRQNAHLLTQLKFKKFPNLPVYSRYTVQRRDIILGIQVGLLVNTKDETQQRLD